MIANILIPVAAAFCLTPWVSSPLALVLGLFLALTIGNPYLPRTRGLTPWLLQASVVGLGASMDLRAVLRVGAQGFATTVLSIGFICVVGWFLGRKLRVPPVTSLLITVGTAICGGSAIAAVAATVRAKHEEISIALGTVFLLNALALLIFPPIGHVLGMSEEQFGVWSALSIHDTSSVVGAALQFGPRALEIATTIKLSRALWILPMTLLVSAYLARREGAAPSGTSKAKRPWFILGFVAAAAVVTWVPALAPAGQVVAGAAKRGLVLVLFLIGCGLTPAALRAVGIRPFIQGAILWVVTAMGTALLICGAG